MEKFLQWHSLLSEINLKKYYLLKNNYLSMFFYKTTNIETDFILSCTKIIDFLNVIRIKNILFNDLLINIRKTHDKMTFILRLFNINISFFYSLVKILEEPYKYSDKQFKYCIEYNLFLILYMKNNLNNWSSLQHLILCHNPYGSVYNQFLRWSKKDLFFKAFNENINENIDIINKHEIHIIDASACNNKYGSENITINPEYKKKKVTKISLLCNEDKIITAVVPFNINLTNKKFKNEYIKTYVHDSKTIQKTIDKVDKNITIKHILGDGGYKTKEEIKHNDKVIKIITPNRKNQKNNLINNEEKNELCKKRYKVENVFSSIKMNNERIFLRKDRKLKHFMSWFYIACLEHNIKIIKK